MISTRPLTHYKKATLHKSTLEIGPDCMDIISHFIWVLHTSRSMHVRVAYDIVSRTDLSVMSPDFRLRNNFFTPVHFLYDIIFVLFCCDIVIDTETSPIRHFYNGWWVAYPLPNDPLIPRISTHRKTSGINRTKFQNLNVSCILLHLSSLNPLKPGVKLKMKM